MVGGEINLDSPFLLVSQHPVTTEYGRGEEQITNTLNAVKSMGLDAIVLWPNADAGSEDISRGMRKWREKGLDKKMRFFKNLPIEVYVHLMNKTVCLVGNSSSGIREGAFLGTPAVNIGSRQDMRQRGKNVLDVGYEKEKIKKAVETQVKNGRYDRDPVYGNGTAGTQMAKILAETKSIEIQKRITY